MKIKIVEPGGEKFSGFIGHIEFHDGVSVGDVSGKDAKAVSAIYRTEQVKNKPAKQEPVSEVADEGDANTGKATEEVEKG